MGLSPKFMSGSNTGGELLITSLVKSSAIKKAIFSLYIATTKEQSKMFLGGYDDAYVKA